MGFATSDSDAPPNYNHIILHPPPHHEVTNDTSSPIIYEVIIVSEELGIFIKLENDRLITSNPSKHSPIRSNSWILSIQGVDCSHLSVERLDRLLKATHRPLRIKLGWQQFKRDIKPGVPRPKEKVKVVKKRKLPTKPRSDGRDPWQPEEDAALLNGVKKYDLDFGRIKAEDNALPIPVLFRRTTRALGDHFRYVCPSRFKAMKASGHKVTFDIPITPINNTTPITPIVN
ncbi:hypothetical protein TrLO_g13341 [Triparma laevis f. longispina]|uniref:Uncharacterized protein n=1 Tax=Triparma laevis f. longispina TaxID=1714387 RepID=A0A9W7FHT9_9STRA|nr:hypothetical protein TrLO_g13341 [Triparma laevis f. longispina]